MTWLSACRSQAIYGYRDLHEGFALARATVERALALDDSLAEAHAIMVRIRMYYDWDWQGANEAMQRALALAPRKPYVLGTASLFAGSLGRLDEALQFDRRVIELDPLDRVFHFNHGWHLTMAGQLDEAAATFRHVLELNPQAPHVHFRLGLIFLLQNQAQMGLAEMEREIDPMSRDLGTVLALSALGRKADGDQALAAFIEQHKESTAYSIAQAYAWRGNADRAFRWLDTAYEQRDSFLADILTDPLLASLKTDPRWPAFLDKMGLPHHRVQVSGESTRTGGKQRLSAAI